MCELTAALQQVPRLGHGLTKSQVMSFYVHVGHPIWPVICALTTSVSYLSVFACIALLLVDASLLYNQY